jgi:hypothetical protein
MAECPDCEWTFTGRVCPGCGWLDPSAREASPPAKPTGPPAYTTPLTFEQQAECFRILRRVLAKELTAEQGLEAQARIFEATQGPGTQS